MDAELMRHLCGISPEEQAILDGRTTIDRELYMQGQDNTVNSRKLLSAGKLITIRPHTRFIHFPEHTHDYVEVVFMCQGQTRHIVNGRELLLRQGELLFLSQSATHEVCRAEETDVAVNLIVLPDFFAATLPAVGEEETPLRRFLVDALCGRDPSVGYLHFKVSQVMPVQNLVENLLWTLISETGSRRKVTQMTMALLFMLLLDHTDVLATEDREDAAVLQVLRYVETNYKNGSLTELAELLHYDFTWLSREIKRRTGKTYTQLVQDKRLAQAAFLLKNTDTNVADVSAAVGYENVSYFHRLFCAAYRKTPKHYRDEAKVQIRTLF